MNSLKDIFTKKKPFIGMVHLRPSVGYTDYPGESAYLEHALRDARALAAGGADAILVENDRDMPHTVVISNAQCDCITNAIEAIRAEIHIPVGVGVLLNDWKAALDIAKTTGCAFIRIDVFVDRVDCPAGQGIIEPEAEEIVAYRKSIGEEDIAIFADIQVKHKILLEVGKPLTLSAQQAFDAGANAVIVTGPATGQETPLADIQKVKSAFPDSPVFVGAGVNTKNVLEQLCVADGIIVGTSLKTPEDTIDAGKVREITELIAGL